jgi:hypothetical protein
MWLLRDELSTRSFYYTEISTENSALLKTFSFFIIVEVINQ